MPDDAQSIHVPASTVQRALRVWRWLLPYVTGAALTAVGFSARWLESRVSREDLGAAVGPVQTIAAAAQATGFHADSLATDHAEQLAVLWRRVVAIEAELMVHRDYGRADPARRGRLIVEARRFYAAEYEQQLRTHATDPAESARLALLTQWRPPP